MANVNITSKECAWSKFEVKLLGRTIKGLRGFSFKKTVEKEHLYAAGSQPIDIMDGNVKYEGSIKILGFELDALNKAAQVAQYSDITEVPHEAIVITCSYCLTAQRYNYFYIYANFYILFFICFCNLFCK